MAPEQSTGSQCPHGRDLGSPRGKRSSPRKSDRLLKRLLLIFSLLGLIAVGVNVKFLLDVSAELKSSVGTTMDKVAETNIGKDRQSVNTLVTSRKRIAILLVLTVVCFGTVIYLFVRRIVIPLDRVTRTAQEMAIGDLSVSALRNPHRDVAELGEALNDLAANFQEVLLLMGTTVGNSLATHERIKKILNVPNGASPDELQSRLDDLRKDLELLSSLVKEFNFYQTRFDGRKVVPENTGSKS
jgi:methyl-accepting chemotaxis protein